MEYADESYVRLYIRDTLEWKMLGWEGQTVLLHMLKGKFDRAGIYETGKYASAQAVAAITGLPKDLVDEGLQNLLAAGTWVETKTSIVWPSYVHAQTVRSTDRKRSRELRERRAAESQGVTHSDDSSRHSDTPSEEPDTPGDNPSRENDPRHTRSHGVTNSLDQSRIVQPSKGAGGRISCPVDLALTEKQRQSLIVSMIPEWAIDLITTKLVAKFVEKPDPRALANWRNYLSSSIVGEWATNKPKKPAAPKPEEDPGADFFPPSEVL